MVNTTDATLGNNFNARQLTDLPSEGRDPVAILSLQPGVTYIGNTTNIQQNSDSRGGAVNGARSDQSNITLDGLDDNDQLEGYAFEGAMRATLDSLQEFRVTTGNYDADSGRSSGAQVTWSPRAAPMPSTARSTSTIDPTLTSPTTGSTSRRNLRPGCPTFRGLFCGIPSAAQSVARSRRTGLSFSSPTKASAPQTRYRPRARCRRRA